MKKYTFILLFIIASFNSLAQNEVLVIKNITIVDVVNNKAVAAQTVIIQSNKIVSVGRTVKFPKEATIIDGKGKYIIPGLWDMHTHTLRKGRISNFFPLFIANGVTGIRDMASDMNLDEITTIRNEVETAKILGPRLGAFTGKILDGPPKPDSLLFTYPADTNVAAKTVRSYKEQGASFIKVYDMLSKDIYYAIATEAKKNNIPYAGHVPFAITAAEASNAGQRSIEHLSDILLSISSNETELRAELAKFNSANAIQSNHKRRAISFEAAKNYSKEKVLALSSIFVHNGTWQCPTLRNLQIVTTHADSSLLIKDARMKYFANSLIENWKRILVLRVTGDSSQRAIYFQQTLRLVHDMHSAGVKMLAGTDLSSTFQMPGFSLHDELGLMVEAGLKPFEALQTATINAAIFLDREKDFGSVESGKIADLILLEGNPLKDISNTKKINAVIVNGKLFQRKDLDELLRQVELNVKK